MASTGEVACFGVNKEEAFLKVCVRVLQRCVCVSFSRGPRRGFAHVRVSSDEHHGNYACVFLCSRVLMMA